MNTSLIATADASGARLDTWLATQLPDFSRSKLQKLIKAGQVKVNGKNATPHDALAEGDRIEVQADAQPDPNAPLVPRVDIKLDVLHEDADILVVNKPAGLVVHPAVVGETDTLVNAIVARYPEIAKVGDSPERPGIVHRLDKEASGLLVVARTQAAFETLKEQFKAHTIHKEYAVLVDGSVPRDADTITMPIGRSSTGKRMAAHPDNKKRATQEAAHDDDRNAITHYHLEESFPRNSFLTVRTETGRTHQIRAHVHALGTPVVGDALYGEKKTARLAAKRLFLHCKTLGFTHPKTGKEMKFESPLPADLEAILAKLRGK